MVDFYQNRIEQHRFNNDIVECLSQLEAVKNLADLSSEHRSHIERYFIILSFVNEVFRGTPDYFMPMTVVDRIADNMLNIINSLKNFTSNQADSYLSQVDDFVDRIIVDLPGFITPKSMNDIQRLKSVVDNLIKSINKDYSKVSDEFKKITSQLSNAENTLKNIVSTIDSEKQRLDNTITQFSNAFTEQQNDRLKTFTEAEKERVSINNRNSEQFIAEKKALYEKTSSEIINMKLETFNELIEIRDSYVDKKDEILAQMEEDKRQVRNIFKIVNSDSTTGAYKLNADTERKIKNRWHNMAVVGFIALIFYSILSSINIISNDLSWMSFANRWYVFITTGLFTGYAARQANLLNKIEQENRDKQLRLATIEAFLSTFDPEEVEKMKKKYFGKLFFENNFDPMDDNIKTDKD